MTELITFFPYARGSYQIKKSWGNLSGLVDAQDEFFYTSPVAEILKFLICIRSVYVKEVRLMKFRFSHCGNPGLGQLRSLNF